MLISAKHLLFVPGQRSYLLRDTFDDAVAAGSVNGTRTVSGSIRTVVDTNSVISISGSKLTVATGSAGNDGVWYSLVPRVPGRCLFLPITLLDTVGATNIGWDSNQSGGATDLVRFLGSGSLAFIGNGGSSTVVGTYTATSYTVCFMMRSSGMAIAIKGGIYTNWTLLTTYTGGTGNLYPVYHLSNSTAQFTVDTDVRIPMDFLHLPSPIASDGFSIQETTDGLGHAEGVSGELGSGGASLTWADQSSTWTVSGGLVSNNPPVTGSELSTNGDMESWASATDLNNWTETLSGTSTINREATVIHGGTYAVRVDIDSSNSSASINQDVTTVTGTWYLLSVWLKNSTTSKTVRTDFTSLAGRTVVLSTTYTQFFWSRKAVGTTTNITPAGRVSVASSSIYIDDLSIKALTLKELFRTLSNTSSSYIASVEVTNPTNGTEAGLVCNLDSATTPANFVLATLSFNNVGGLVNLYKCVAGTYTTVISAAVTYSAGAMLRLVKHGTTVLLYYNNAQVGSTSTISDAGVINNTISGLFSTHSGVTLDNYVFRPDGSNGELDILNTR